MGAVGFLVHREKALDEYFQQRIRMAYYWRRMSRVYKFRVKNPPQETTGASVDAVWKKYIRISPKWAQYYWSINGIASPYYIPSGVWFAYLCRKLNSLDRFGWPQFQDKNYLDLVFRDVKQPAVVVRNIAGQYLDASFNAITLEQAAGLCQGPEELLIKPSIESKGGKGIKILTADETAPDQLARIFRERERDFVVQRVLRQHGKMAELNPDSVNTVRIQTLLWEGEVHILSALVRVGVAGCRIDNPHTSNGVSCVLTPEGKMIRTAYDRDWKPKTVLPNGMAPEGFQVPFYDRLVEAVTKLQYRVPHARLVGWDMSVSEDGEPVLIEANLDYPEVYFHQLGKGPLITDPALFSEIMGFVFRK